MSAAQPDDDGLGASVEVPPGGLRHRLRTNPATKLPYRMGVFVLGLLFILLGVALVTLPGPLTIPPMLVGLWIWSSEFAWAERFFDQIKEKADEAWEHAKAHPKSSAAITVGGLIGAAVAIWAVLRFDLIEKGKDAIGL